MDRWTRTHEALQRAALELFSRDGYDATSTARIAARAGVSEVTLFRHFPTKEALLLADPFDPLIARAVRSRPSEETAMRALIEGVRQAWGHLDTDAADALRTRLRLAARATGLDDAIMRNSGQTVTALATALRERGVDDAEARVAATALVSGLGTALTEWACSDREDLRNYVNRALDVLGGA